MRASISLTGALILSYPRGAAVRRQVGKGSTDTAAQRGARAESHELSVVGRVGLADLDVGDAGGAEARGDLVKLRFARRGEHDGEGAGLKVSGARLARRVCDLGGGDAGWQVRPHDDVVGQRIRPGVNWRATLPDSIHRDGERQVKTGKRNVEVKMSDDVTVPRCPSCHGRPMIKEMPLSVLSELSLPFPGESR